MKLLCFLLMFLIAQIIFGQEIIFPGLKGDSLRNAIVTFYTPSNILPYDQARTKLYNDVFSLQALWLSLCQALIPVEKKA